MTITTMRRPPRRASIAGATVSRIAASGSRPRVASTGRYFERSADR